MRMLFRIGRKKAATEVRSVDSVEALALLEDVVREAGVSHKGGPMFVFAGRFECITGRVLGKLGYSPQDAAGALLPYAWRFGVTHDEQMGRAPRRVVFTTRASEMLEEARVLNDEGWTWGHIFAHLSGVDLSGVHA